MTSAQVERLPTDQLASMQSDALLAAIVRSSSDAIIAKDLNGIVMSWNPAVGQDHRRFEDPARSRRTPRRSPNGCKASASPSS